MLKLFNKSLYLNSLQFLNRLFVNLIAIALLCTSQHTLAQVNCNLSPFFTTEFSTSPWGNSGLPSCLEKGTEYYIKANCLDGNTAYHFDVSSNGQTSSSAFDCGWFRGFQLPYDAGNTASITIYPSCIGGRGGIDNSIYQSFHFDVCDNGNNSGGSWGSWLDRDNPSGTGDWELVSDFTLPCTPIDIEARIIGSSQVYVPGDSTPDNLYIFSASGGLSCRNNDQADGYCGDYEVRFKCP